MSLGQSFLRTWIGTDQTPQKGQFSISKDGIVSIALEDGVGNDETGKIVPAGSLFLEFLYWKISIPDTGLVVTTANIKYCENGKNSIMRICTPTDPYLLIGMTYDMNLNKTKTNNDTYGAWDIFILIVAFVFFTFLIAAAVNFFIVHVRHIRS